MVMAKYFNTVLIAGAMVLAGTMLQAQTVGDVLRSQARKGEALSIKKQQNMMMQLEPDDKPKNFAPVRPTRKPKKMYRPNTNHGDLESTIDGAISQLYTLMKKFEKSPRRYHMWLKMGENYLEKAHLIEQRLESEFEKNLLLYEQKKRKVIPTLNLEPKFKYVRKAKQLFEWFIAAEKKPNFPPSARRQLPQAMAQLGRSYFELDQHSKGIQLFGTFMKRYPRSPHMPEVYFQLADYYFEAEKWQLSLAYYNRLIKAVRQPDKRQWFYSRRAWCYYRMRQVRKGLADLETVIKMRDSQGGQRTAQFADEAIKDLVWFYGELGEGHQQARSYFSRVLGPEEAERILPKIAQHLADTGQRKGALYLFRDLISKKPSSKEAFHYEHQIVRLFMGSRDLDKHLRKEMMFWLSEYGPSSRYQKMQSDKAFVQQSNQTIEKTLRRYIKQRHVEMQKTKNTSFAGVLAGLYSRYFLSFSNQTQLNQSKADQAKQEELRFFYAELLFDQRQYIKAAEQYGWVVTKAPQSKYAKQARLNRVLSLEKTLPKPAEMEKQLGKSKTLLTFTPRVQAFVQAAEEYIAQTPRSKNLADISYRVAFMYYIHNQFDKAQVAFRSIIKKHPRSRYMPLAVEATLDMHNSRKEYEKLSLVTQELLADPNVARNAKLSARVKKISSTLGFNKASELEKSSNFLQAATSYEQLGRKSPSTKTGVDALYNAAVNFEKSNKFVKAIVIYKELARSKSPHARPHQQKSRHFLAELYERTGQYEKAAFWHEQWAKKAGRKGGQSYRNAAVIYDGLNRYADAERNYKAFVAAGASPINAAETLAARAAMALRQGKMQSFVTLSRLYSKHPQARAAEVMRFWYTRTQHYKKTQQHKQYAQVRKAMLAKYKTLSADDKEASAGWVAELRFEQVLPVYKRFTRIKLQGATKTVVANLKKRGEILGQMSRSLKEVIAYNDAPFVVAALVLTAQAENNMAAAVVSSPVPKQFKDEQIAQYKSALDKKAQPHRDKALKFYQTAVQKAYELQAYGEWLDKAVRGLGEIDKTQQRFMGLRVMSSREPLIDQIAHDDLKAVDRNGPQAVAQLADILAQKPQHLEALNALAVYHLQRRQYGLAEIVLRRALKQHPKQAALHNNLGVVFSKRGKPLLARAEWKKAVQADEGRVAGATNLSSILLKNYDYKTAGVFLRNTYARVQSSLGRGQEAAVRVANNYAVALAGGGDFAGAQAVLEPLRVQYKIEKVPVLLNSAIVMVKQGRREAGDVLSRLNFLANDAQTKKQVLSLQKSLQAIGG